MWKEIREYLGYNKSERRGLASLIILILFVIGCNILLPSMLKPGLNRLDEEKALEMKQLLKKVRLIEEEAKQATSKLNKALSDFNPNTADLSELLALGFTQKQASTIINYRSKGGVFRIRSDLEKMYSISKSEYLRYKPYILLPEENEKRKIDQASIQNQALSPTIELNSADSSELVKIRGIGPVFARRIVSYRRLLGGYINKQQLLEVYGMKREYYENVRESVTIDTNLVRKLDLVNDDFKSLLRHPYLDYETTKAICNARKADSLSSNMALLHFMIMELDSMHFRLAGYLILD